MFRRWFGWVLPGAVVAVGVFAGLDAFRSSGGEPPPTSAERDRAVTTMPTETAAVLLTNHRPVGLTPGNVSTDLDSSLVVTFMVPPGWYGYQDETGFVLGMGLVGEEVDLVPGGLTVYVLDLALADAARRLEQVEGVQVKSPVRMGGSLGRRYARRLGLLRDVTLVDLGLHGVVVPSSPDLILLGARRKTLVIRRHFTNDADRAEVNGVLMSFRVTTDVQEIEQLGNRWAQLFGAGQRCNQLMGQPLCERINCERGGRPIRNCTPLSPKVQRSFADAVVREIVIRGRHAAARFSNGETVRFTKARDWRWFIDRVGAGRKLFADQRG